MYYSYSMWDLSVWESGAYRMCRWVIRASICYKCTNFFVSALASFLFCVKSRVSSSSCMSALGCSIECISLFDLCYEEMSCEWHLPVGWMFPCERGCAAVICFWLCSIFGHHGNCDFLCFMQLSMITHMHLLVDCSQCYCSHGQKKKKAMRVKLFLRLHCPK